MGRKKELVLLTLVLLVATFFRFWKLGQIPGFDDDEALSLLVAKNIYLGRDFPVVREYSIYQLATFSYLEAFSFHLFGISLWSGRVVVAFFGVLTVAATYFLTKRLFDAKAGFVASFLMAVSLWHVAQSRAGWGASLVPFYVTATILFFLKGLENEGKESFYWAGLFAGLGLHDHPYTILIPIILLFYAFSISKGKPLLRERAFWGGVGIALVAYAPMLLWNLSNDFQTFHWFLENRAAVEFGVGSSTVPSISFMEKTSAFSWSLQHILSGEYYWVKTIAFPGERMFFMSPLFLIGFFYIGWSSYARRNEDKAVEDLLLIWFVIVLIFLPFVVHKEQEFDSLKNTIVIIRPAYFDVLFPLPYIVIARFLTKFPDTISSRRWGQVNKKLGIKRLSFRDVFSGLLIVSVLLPSTNFAYINYFVMFEKTGGSYWNTESENVAKFVAENAGPTTVVVGGSVMNQIRFFNDRSNIIFYTDTENLVYRNFSRILDPPLSVRRVHDGVMDVFYVSGPMKYYKGLGIIVDVYLSDEIFRLRNPGIHPVRVFYNPDGYPAFNVYHIKVPRSLYTDAEFDFKAHHGCPIREDSLWITFLVKYNLIEGFGWNDTAEIRNSSIAERTGCYIIGFSDASFDVDVSNGLYEVNIDVDNPFLYKELKFDILVEETGKNRIMVKYGGKETENFLVDVSDGQLNIEFVPYEDSKYWSVSSISLHRLS